MAMFQFAQWQLIPLSSNVKVTDPNWHIVRILPWNSGHKIEIIFIVNYSPELLIYQISRNEEVYFSDLSHSLREMRLNPHEEVRLNWTLENSQKTKIPVSQFFKFSNI